MNVEFLNSIYQWSGPTLTITLQKHASNVAEGVATISKKAYSEEQRRVETQKVKEAAKGLVSISL